MISAASAAPTDTNKPRKSGVTDLVTGSARRLAPFITFATLCHAPVYEIAGLTPVPNYANPVMVKLSLMLADSLFLQTRRWDAVQEVARYVAELEAQADFGLAAKYRAVLMTLL